MAPPAKQEKGASALTLVVLFVLWYGFNAFYNVSNKKVLNIFPFPWTVAFLQTAIGLLYIQPLWTLGIQTPPKLTNSDRFKLTPIALLHSLGHLAAVLSMGAGAVSFTHIIKASEPVASTVIAPFFGIAADPIFVNLCLIPIVGGVAYAAMKPGAGLDLSDLKSYASATAMFSNIAFALRGILSKRAMTPEYKRDKNMTSSNTYAVLTGLSSLILAPIAVIAEGDKLWAGYDKIADKSNFWVWLLSCGLTYYLYNEMGFRVLGYLSPVETAVGNTVKRIVIMGAAVAFLGESMNSNKTIGASVAIGGTLLYSLAKNSATQSKAKAKAKAKTS